MGGAKDFPFEVAYTDICGQRKPTATPLLFVGEVANNTKDEAIRKAYNKSAPVETDRGSGRRDDLLRAVHRRRQGRSPPAHGQPDLRRRRAARRRALSARPELLPGDRPGVRRHQAGAEAPEQAGAVAKVTYPDVYKQHGFGEQDPAQNKGKLFLQLVDQLLHARVR